MLNSNLQNHSFITVQVLLLLTSGLSNRSNSGGVRILSSSTSDYAWKHNAATKSSSTEKQSEKKGEKKFIVHK